jgi:hypothetical protein
MDDKKPSKVGEALERDWEQTKHDIKKDTGKDLNQGVGDTIKQGAGREPIPPPNVPNPTKR